MKNKIIAGLISLVAAGTLATAGEVKESSSPLHNLYVGFQSSGFTSSGISIKYAFTDDIKAQVILGLIGDVTAYEGRGLYSFSHKGDIDMYGYAGVGQWSWENTYYDESVVGYTIGGGAEYDIRKLDNNLKDLPAIYINGELGFEYVNFEHYSYGGVTLGVGIHYRF